LKEGPTFCQEGVEAFGPEGAAMDSMVVRRITTVTLLAVADLERKGEEDKRLLTRYDY
jgi:hypothetical protein